MSLKLFTTDNYDENEYTPLGFVRGTMVHSISILRDFVGNVTAMFGGPNSAINKKIDDTHDEAIQELIKYTTAKYPSATAIAGISISLTELREFIICVACGTALAPKTSSSSSSTPVNITAPKGGFKRHKYYKTMSNMRQNKKRYTKRR
jgi:uncharacterized protein YbjQ (UPF0145 family)